MEVLQVTKTQQQDQEDSMVEAVIMVLDKLKNCSKGLYTMPLGHPV